MMNQKLSERLRPVSTSQVFQMEDWYVWGASVCREKDMYYMFASAWKKEYGFFGWVQHSTIIMGKSEKPEGPYRFVREMKELKKQSWSSEVLHNPTVIKIGNMYYLYYIGTNGTLSKWNRHLTDPREIYRYNQKIGVASTTTMKEAFIPSEKNPVLEPEEGRWDDSYVTNPTVLADEDGVFLIYKALLKEKLPEIVMKLGIARADHPDGCFYRLENKPMIDENIEDPFLWKEGDTYFLIAKDMTGKLAGKPNEAVLYRTKDITKWVNPPEKAYGTDIIWTDGIHSYTNVERPQIYMEDGKPVCIYNAVGNLPDNSFNVARRFWNE